MKKAIQIPLNPPFLKGDFNSPLRKRGGAGGIFRLQGAGSMSLPIPRDIDTLPIPIWTIALLPMTRDPSFFA